MFSNLRTNAPIYILHRQDIKVEIGEVLSVSQPQPQYNIAYQNGMIQQPKTYVDIRVKVGDQTIDLQKLPSEQTIADCNGMVVSENKDAIINEISALASLSQSVIDSVERHTETLSRCNQLLTELNPEVKRDAERAKEISELRNEVGELKGLLTQLLNNKNKGE